MVPARRRTGVTVEFGHFHLDRTQRRIRIALSVIVSKIARPRDHQRVRRQPRRVQLALVALDLTPDLVQGQLGPRDTLGPIGLHG